MGKCSQIVATVAGVAGLCAVSTVVPSGPAEAAVIFFDDFNHGQGATNNFSGLANWSVTVGTVDAFTNGGFGLPCPSLGCLDMDGSTGAAGTIESNTAFNLGPDDYSLSLNVAGSQRGSASDAMDVFIGASFLGTITLNPSDPYAVVSFPFSILAPTSAAITIAHQGGDNVGILLDSVTLESRNGQTSVPEPGTIALLGLGLAAVGLARRGRRTI